MSSNSASPASPIDRHAEIVARIESRQHRHIALLIGSAASCAPPTRCANVWEIRDGMVLDPLVHHVRDGVSRGTFSPATLSLLEQVLAEYGTDGRPVPLKWDIDALPFEQFMGCLHKANHDIADAIVGRACGPGEHESPNHNHIAAVALGACLLDRDLAERVTILTTNYDLGLERAVVGELTPIVGIDDFVPSLSARLPSGKTLQLVKLHGCIERGRLVYAFSQMGRLLFETDRLRGVLAALSAGAGYPSLYLTIGYSFSDPDLRPMFLDAFSRTRPLIYRNERPPDASAGSLSFERQEHLARTGQAILQHEFFTRAMELVEDVRVHHSDLYCKDGSAERISLPVRLARHFGAADLPVSEAVGGQAGGHEPLADAIQQFTEPQVLVFLGGLVDACARSDALGALRVGLAKSPDSNMRGEIIRLYLSQYGHSHRMADAAKECARLGRELQEPDVRLIANAYRSLALSIGPAGPLRARQFWAAVPLLRARFLMNQVDFKWQVYYEHYALHFWTKVREVAAVALSRLPGRFGQWAGRAILRRHARKLEACIKTALELESPDLETAADVQSLLAEVRVHLRDEAVSFAERMRQIRAALGTLNRVALVDRQLGWAYLSEDNDQSRDKAIQAFARGLWLATYSADRSIEPKLGADLVRAVHAGHPEDLEQLHAELPSDEVGAVRDICRSVGVGERSVHDMLSEDCRRMLVRHLRFLYLRPDDSVLELVTRHTDTARYPMFLAPDPSCVKIRAVEKLAGPQDRPDDAAVAE